MELKKKRINYFISALLLTLFCIGLGFLDKVLVADGYLSIAVKFLLVIFFVLYLTSKKERFFGKIKAKYIIFIVLPFVFSFLLAYSKTDVLSNRYIFIKNLIFLLVSILLEELFFRSFVVKIFDEDGVVSLSNVIFSVIVFTICNTPVLFFAEIKASIFEIIMAFTFDVFIFGLYLSSKNLFLCIISSFVSKATFLYFSSFSISQIYFGETLIYVIFALVNLFYLLIGSIFIMRNTVRK